MRTFARTLVALAVITTGLTSAATAGKPFGLFCNKSTCDSAPCESAPCDSDCCASSACDNGGCASKQATVCDAIACNPCCTPKTYCSMFGGWTELSDYNGENEFVFPAADLRGTFSDGWAIGFAKGKRIKDALRGEIEFAFRSNTADTWSINGVSGDFSGHVFGYTGMANLLYDLRNCSVRGITPYVGGGIGLAILDGEFQTSSTEINIEDEVFAYQFIVGGSKALNNNVEVFSEYRFLEVLNVDVENVGVSPMQLFGKDDFELDNFLFGLRIYR